MPRMGSIKDMLKRVPTQQQQQRSEEEEIRLALELSKQEHVNEQKRMFEQLAARLSTENTSQQTFRKKRRIIQMDDDEEDEDITVKGEPRKEEVDNDEDQWFQTVSSRPQSRISLSRSKSKSIKTNKKDQVVEKIPVKKEPEKNKVLLDIDDVTAFLNTKEEKKEESYDLTSLLMEESDTTEDRNRQIEGEETKAQMISDSDSDCSLIDLVETPWTEESNIPQPIEEEDGDGYLSPLEGFTSLNDVRGDESYNNYYNQFATTTTSKPKVTRKRKTTTGAPKKRKFYNRKKFWANKKKK